MPPNTFLDEKELEAEQTLHQLILSYLVHHGYTSTAKAVVENSKYVSGQELCMASESDIPENDMEQRHRTYSTGSLFNCYNTCCV